DPVYQSPGQYSTSAVWVAVVAYSLQVYGDFSGYSDIALGTAHMLGFKLPENFNMPYMARNVAEFWRRWHISLSTWLRDYVFIPLGGSKGTYLKTSVTLMVTMALCGLWHGAKWTYVGFGVVQGVMMITQRSFRGWCKVRPKVREMLETKAGTTLRILVTYWTFIVSLVIFRSQDFHRMWMTFHAMFHSQDGLEVTYPVNSNSLVFTFLVVAVAHVVGDLGLWKKAAGKFSAFEWGLAYTVVLILAFMMAPESQKAFIYFQF
ncbi:MAG: MBOAT family O-acyltransferase, partial [Chthoniobacteraceae bacterium]